MSAAKDRESPVAAASSARATISDVALQAGVSRAAVSKVLRGAYGVSPDMERRVRATMAELEYRPKMAARALRGRTHALGVLVPNLANPLYPAVVEGLTRALTETSFEVFVRPAPDSADGQAEAARLLIDYGMEGLLLVRPTMTDEDMDALADQVPVVLTGRHSTSPKLDSFGGDDVLGAHLQLDHLLDLGHRRIAFISRARTSDLQQKLLSPAVRERAFVEAAENHRRPDVELRVLASEMSEAGGHRAALELLSTAQPPTAIVTLADVVALGVLRAAHERGVRVPGDVSVVGYDDVPIGDHPLISLTTVSPRPGTHGVGGASALSVHALLERIGGRRTSRHEQFPPRLVTRGSTGAPRAAAGRAQDVAS